MSLDDGDGYISDGRQGPRYHLSSSPRLIEPCTEYYTHIPFVVVFKLGH